MNYKINYKDIFGEIVLGKEYNLLKTKTMNDLQLFVEIHGYNPSPFGDIKEKDLYERAVRFGLLEDDFDYVDYDYDYE